MKQDIAIGAMAKRVYHPVTESAAARPAAMHHPVGSMRAPHPPLPPPLSSTPQSVDLHQLGLRAAAASPHCSERARATDPASARQATRCGPNIPTSTSRSARPPPTHSTSSDSVPAAANPPPPRRRRIHALIRELAQFNNLVSACRTRQSVYREPAAKGCIFAPALAILGVNTPGRIVLFLRRERHGGITLAQTFAPCADRTAFWEHHQPVVGPEVALFIQSRRRTDGAPLQNRPDAA